MPLRVEMLGRQHRALLEDFRNQHQSLVDYLRRFALRHAEKDLLARTFLAIAGAAGEERLAGYFTLATASVERSTVGAMESLDRLPGFPIPAVLLARLAVDERAAQFYERFGFTRVLDLKPLSGPRASIPR